MIETAVTTAILFNEENYATILAAGTSIEMSDIYNLWTSVKDDSDPWYFLPIYTSDDGRPISKSWGLMPTEAINRVFDYDSEGIKSQLTSIIRKSDNVSQEQIDEAKKALALLGDEANWPTGDQTIAIIAAANRARKG